MPLPRLTRLIPILALLAIPACETVQGAGRDLQSAGRTVTSESQEVQNDL